MKISKKIKNLTLGGLIALNSFMPLKAYADKPEYSKQLISQELSKEEHQSSNKLLNIPKIFVNGYAADVIMVGVHEKGHNNEAFNQGLHSDIKIEPRPFWVNGSSPYEGSPKTKMDKAKIDIAGFVNAGSLAEQLRNEINISGVSKDELRFKSMLALACELNLPVYFGMHYLGTDYTGVGMDDIQNFSDSSGIKPEQMLVGSGLHLILNSPYLYKLTKNALGYNTKNEKPKKLDISFRYDGDNYSLNIHADMDSLIEKIEKPSFSKFGSKF